MGLRQTFKFEYNSTEDIRKFLHSFSEIAECQISSNLYIFSQKIIESNFIFDCELVDSGFITNRSGDYFKFLGIFIEELTGQFGKVEIEDT